MRWPLVREAAFDLHSRNAGSLRGVLTAGGRVAVAAAGWLGFQLSLVMMSAEAITKKITAPATHVEIPDYSVRTGRNGAHGFQLLSMRAV